VLSQGMPNRTPDKTAFYGTLILVCVPSVLFFVFICPHLIERLTVLVLVVPVYVCIVCLVALILASETDPGVIPRSINVTEPPPDPLPKETVSIRGRDVQTRWCSTCNILRPPRASHCSDCDRCVMNFDHHCPWVGNCVGKRNYRFFVMFLVTTTFLIAYFFTFSVIRIVWLIQSGSTFLDALLESPIAMVLILLTFFLFWSVGGLTAYHHYLICIGLTTNEDVKEKFGEAGSPYSEGVLWNVVSVYFPPRWPTFVKKQNRSTPDKNRSDSEDEALLVEEV